MSFAFKNYDEKGSSRGKVRDCVLVVGGGVGEVRVERPSP